MSAHTELAQEVFDTLAAEDLSFAGTLTKPGKAVYNPATQSRGTASPTTAICYVLFMKMKVFPQEVEVKDTDKFALVAANGVEIAPDDKITVGSDTYTVLPGTTENSVGANALFEVLMR